MPSHLVLQLAPRPCFVSSRSPWRHLQCKQEPQRQTTYVLSLTPVSSFAHLVPRLPQAPLPVPARSLTVYHRFTSTSHSSPFFSVPKGEWVEKGRIDVFPPGEVGEGEAAAYIPSSSAWHEWNVPLRAGEWSGNVGQVGGERYQIAIRDEDTTATELPFISVDPVRSNLPLCHRKGTDDGPIAVHALHVLEWRSRRAHHPLVDLLPVRFSHLRWRLRLPHFHLARLGSVQHSGKRKQPERVQARRAEGEGGCTRKSHGTGRAGGGA